MQSDGQSTSPCVSVHYGSFSAHRDRQQWPFTAYAMGIFGAFSAGRESQKPVISYPLIDLALSGALLIVYRDDGGQLTGEVFVPTTAGDLVHCAVGRRSAFASVTLQLAHERLW